MPLFILSNKEVAVSCPVKLIGPKKGCRIRVAHMIGDKLFIECEFA